MPDSPDPLPGDWEQGRAQLLLAFLLAAIGVCTVALCFCIWITRQSDYYIDAWLCRSDEDGCLDMRSCYMTERCCLAVCSGGLANDSGSESDSYEPGDSTEVPEAVRQRARPPPLSPPPVGVVEAASAHRYSPTHTHGGAPPALSVSAHVQKDSPETPSLSAPAAPDLTTATSGVDDTGAALSQ